MKKNYLKLTQTEDDQKLKKRIRQKQKKTIHKKLNYLKQKY